MSPLDRATKLNFLSLNVVHCTTYLYCLLITKWRLSLDTQWYLFIPWSKTILCLSTYHSLFIAWASIVYLAIPNQQQSECYRRFKCLFLLMWLCNNKWVTTLVRSRSLWFPNRRCNLNWQKVINVSRWFFHQLDYIYGCTIIQAKFLPGYYEKVLSIPVWEINYLKARKLSKLIIWKKRKCSWFLCNMKKHAYF